MKRECRSFSWDDDSVAGHDRDLVSLDPDFEACFPLMSAIIAEEVGVRIALEDGDVDDPAWIERVAELSADALLNKFMVRERTPENPRDRWAPEG